MADAAWRPDDRFEAAEDSLTRALERDDDTPPGPRRVPRPLHRLMVNRELAILGVAIVLFAVFTAANHRFASPEIMISIARRVAIIGIVAVGMTFLFVAGELDLSVGGSYGLLLVFAWFLIERRGMDPWQAVLIILVLGLAIGAINGLLVTVVGLPSFIATLGTWVALRGMSNVLSGGIASQATRGDLAYYQIFSGDVPGTRVPVIFAVMLVVAVIGGVVLAKTRFGSDVYATGGDAEAARSNGIPTRGIKFACFLITGLLCALAASIQFGRLGSVSNGAGVGFELDVIASIIIGGIGLFGGRGTVFGSMVGVAILSMLASGFILMGIKEFWDGVAAGVVILVAAGLDAGIRRGAARAFERAAA